jgi:polysaccharide biosynthesis/export protein
MQLGRFDFARSVNLLAFSLLVICALESNSLAQNPAQNSETGALPAAQPLSDIAHPASQASRESAQTARGEPKDSGTLSDVDPSRIKLSAGDLIEISVYNVPELSTKARVGNSGDVYLPLIDYVHVGGFTVDEAQVVIQKHLEDGGFVRNAHVTIFVDETSQTVTILGEVTRPGMYPALGDRRLYDFISAAGGFTAAAGRKVSVIRQHGEAPITVELPRNLGDDVKDNIEIFPGDTISVPKAPIIYVVGDVGRPTGLLVDNGTLTVLQAIALAGGTNHTAKIGGVRIIRKGSAGMTETKVPLKKMLEAKAPDITLQADDILFVPLSGARVAASQGIQAVVTATTGLAIVAAHP